MRLDSSQNDGVVERLGHIVVGTQLESADHVLALVLGGHHDHRQVEQRIGGAENAQHFQAAHFRHHDIEQDQVETLFAELLEGLVAARGQAHAIPFPLQAPRQHLAVHLIVVHHQQSRLSRSRGCRALGEQRLHLAEQPGQIDRFGFIVVGAGLDGLVPISDHGVSGQSNDGNRACGRRGFQLACGFPPIHDWQTEVHQDQRWPLGVGPVHRFPTVPRGEHTKPLALQSARQHLGVQRVVFDEQNRCHDPFLCRQPGLPGRNPERRTAPLSRCGVCLAGPSGPSPGNLARETQAG